MKYKFLQHTADMKFQAFGKSLEEAFSNAVYALKEVITKDKIKPLVKRTINVKGKDNENLLYNFLEEFLFLLDSENFMISEVDKIIINLEKLELTAVIYGDNIKKYSAITDIKAITYNDMFIKQEKGKFIVQVVVDV